MKKRVFYKIMAYVLLLTLLFPTFGSTHTAHAEHTHATEAVGQENALFVVSEEELAEEKVLVLTEDEADENDNIVIAGGSWERIIIKRSEEVEKIYLQGITAEVLVIEGGMNCDIQLNASSIRRVIVTEPQTGGIGYAELAAALAAKENIGEAWILYAKHTSALMELKDQVPKLKFSGNTKVESVEILTNATVNTTKAEVGKVYIETVNGSLPLSIGVKNYDGTIEMKTVASENSATMAKVFLDLRGSRPEHFHIQAENAYLATQGEDALIRHMEISGSVYMRAMVDTKEVCLTEDTEDVIMKLYADVEKMEVNGDRNEIALTSSANIGHLTVSGDDATIYGYGKLKTAEVNGKNAVVYVPGADVEGEYDKTAPDAMHNMNSNLSGPSIPSGPSTPEIPDEPDTPVVPDEPDEPVVPEEPDEPVVPEEPETPVVTPEPTPDEEPEEMPDEEPEESEHVCSTWNVEEATCVTAKRCTECGKLVQTATGIHTWTIEEANCITEKRCIVCEYVEEAATGVHTFGTEGVVTVPTCTKAGYTTYKCQFCDVTELGDVVAPTGHTVTTWVVGEKVEGKICEYTQKGTCTVEGCGATVVSASTIVKHNEELVLSSQTAATCQIAGQKVYSCPDCGTVLDTVSYTNPDAHKWNDGVEANGKKTYICQNSGCDAKKYEVVMSSEGVSSEVLDASTEVKIDSGVVVALDDATINQVGTKEEGTGETTATTVKLTADTLDKTQKEEAVAILTEEEKEQIGDSEIYDFNMVVDEEEVSEFSGSVTARIPYTLEEGEDPESVAVWYLADDGSVEMIAGTYHDGFITFTTSHFSYYTVVRLTPAERCALYGHITVTTNVAATCEAAGYSIMVCQRCGETKTEAGLPALGHKLTSEVTKEATCQESGVRTYSCSRCDYKDEQSIANGVHTLTKSAEKSATCEEDGYRKYTCVCGYTKTEIVVANGHSADDNGICTVCGIDVLCTHDRAFQKTELQDGATSCLDGIDCVLYCPDCDRNVDSWTMNAHAPSVLRYVDLEEYVDGCEAMVAVQGCACGEEEEMAYAVLDANEWESTFEREIDEQGREHFIFTYFCPNGDLQVVQNHYFIQVSGCDYQEIGQWEVHYNGVTEETIAYETATKQHEWFNKVALKDGSVTCEDGITYYSYCLVCGAKSSVQEGSNHRIGISELIDLTPYVESDGFCGGYIMLKACACGESGFLDTWNNVNCNFSGTGEEITENGETYWLETMTCTECGMVVVNRYTEEELENCNYLVSGTVSIATSKGEEAFDYSYQTVYHLTEEYVTLAEGSASCLDGVLVKRICTKCGLEFGEQVEYGHVTGLDKEVDLSEYTGACGAVFSSYSCPCGEEQRMYWNWNCDMNWSYDNYTDSNGMDHMLETATCANCGLSVERDSVEAKGANCTAVRETTMVVYYEGEVLGVFNYTEEYDSHDTYVASATLNDGSISCTDGVTLIRKCRDCDYERTSTTKNHTRAIVEEIDLSEYGSVCGGYIFETACACGEHEGREIQMNCVMEYEWNDMVYGDYEYVGEINGSEVYRASYNCAVTDPKCDFCAIFEERTKMTDACHTLTERYFCLDTNEDGSYELELLLSSDTKASHNIGDSVTSYTTVDGVAVELRTQTCEDCGRYTNEWAYADYLEDGSYAYKLWNKWGESDDWEQNEWVYTFGSDGCSSVCIWTTSEGNYYEREAENACYAATFASGSSCTQYATGNCAMCNNFTVFYNENPWNHWFESNESGDGYVCQRCGLESENGASGSIVLEDLSDASDYIAGYWNRDELVYSVYVCLVVNGETTMTDLSVTDIGNEYFSGEVSIAKSEVEAYAKANNITGYHVMFSFIPKDTGEDLQFNIGFTNQVYNQATSDGGRIEVTLNESGEIVSQKRYDAEGNYLGKNEIRYENGMLYWVRCCDVNGEYLGEVFFERVEGTLLEECVDAQYGDVAAIVDVSMNNGTTPTFTLVELEQGSSESTIYREDGTTERRYVKEYDAKGVRTKVSNYYYDESEVLEYYEVTEYNENGKQSVRTMYDADGNESSRNEYEYYEDGETLKTQTTYKDGQITNVEKYDSNGDSTGSEQPTYDSDGNLTGYIETVWGEYGGYRKVGSEIKYDVDYNVVATTVYEYNDDGSRKQYTTTDPEGNVIGYAYYNAQEVCIERKQCTYDDNGVVDGYCIETWDANGNRLSCVETDLTDTELTKEIWEYHEDGTTVALNEYYEDGKLVSYTKYDENGQRTERRSQRWGTVDEVRVVTGYYIYTYHSNGNTEYREEYNSDGELEKYIKYNEDQIVSEQRDFCYDHSGDTPVVNGYYIQLNNELGNVLTRTEYDLTGTEVRKHITEYLEDGTTVKLQETYESGVRVSYTRYDDNGQQVESCAPYTEWVDNAEVVTGYQIWTYFSNGNIETDTRYDLNDEIVEYRKYSEDNIILEERIPHYDHSGETLVVDGYTVRKNNDIGNRTSYAVYDLTGTEISKNVIEYLADGTTPSLEEYYKNGERVSYTKYDDNGQKTEERQQCSKWADDVEVVTGYFIQTYYSNGNIENYTEYDLNDEIVAYRKLNESGVCLEERMEMRDENGVVTGYCEIVRNENGKEISSIQYDTEDAETWKQLYEYNTDGTTLLSSATYENGLLSGEVEYYEDGVTEKERYHYTNGVLMSCNKYDAEGNCIESRSSMTDENGNLTGYYITTYNASQNRTSQAEYDANDTELNKQTWEYDTDGTTVTLSAYYENTILKNKTEYSTDGTTETFYTDGEFSSYAKFDATGNRIEECYVETDAEGNVSKYVVTTFDENMNRTSQTEYDASRTETRNQTWEYYEGTSQVSVTTTHANGNLTSGEKYTETGVLTECTSAVYDMENVYCGYIVDTYDTDGVTVLTSIRYDADGNVVTE